MCWYYHQSLHRTTTIAIQMTVPVLEMPVLTYMERGEEITLSGKRKKNIKKGMVGGLRTVHWGGG
jgi:hypothetical protein